MRLNAKIIYDNPSSGVLYEGFVSCLRPFKVTLTHRQVAREDDDEDSNLESGPEFQAMKYPRETPVDPADVTTFDDEE